MVCGKCGAEYDNTFDKCPYCGEVFKIPGSGNKKKTKKYGSKTRKLARFLKIKEETSEKILKVLPVVAIVLAGIAAACVIYAYFMGAGSRESRIKKKNLVILSKYYQEENYKEIYDKVSTIKSPEKDDDYICYYSLYLLYDKGKEYISCSEAATKIMEEKNHDDVIENAKKAFTSLAEVYKQSQDLKAKYGTIKSTSQYIEKIVDWYMAGCMETYKLSKNEIHEIMTEGYSDSMVIEGYADVVFRRISDTAYITDDGETEDSTYVIDEGETDGEGNINEQP